MESVFWFGFGGGSTSKLTGTWDVVEDGGLQERGTGVASERASDCRNECADD